MSPVVLVVQDEPAPSPVVETSLSARGYDVRLVRTGAEALRAIAACEPDLTIVDLGLPDADGVDLCRRIRAWSKRPIVVVSTDCSVEHAVRALDEGADDYITKPFSMPEFLARIRVALRRGRQRVPHDDRIEIGTLAIDVAGRTVTVAGQIVELQPRAFRLLTILGRDADRVVTHQALIQQLWSPESGDSMLHPLRIVVSRLRKSLGHAPGTPQVVTEANVGYRLVADGRSGN